MANEMYPAWSSNYINYDELKKLLKENTVSDGFTDYEEEQFMKYLDAELEKVYSFQSTKYEEINSKIDDLEKKIEVITDGFNWSQFQQQLDGLLSEAKELDHFARLNFTGFEKIVKKHDRLHPNYNSIRALLNIRLKELPFHSEDYSPLLNKISSLFQVLRQNFTSASYMSGSNSVATPNASASMGQQPLDLEYQSFKFWVHKDNLMEVKTRILRHLPVLVYNSSIEGETPDSQDPTITSIYFDNPNFEVYNQKLLKSNSFPTLRLRWSGKFTDKPDIFLEKKIVDKIEDNEDGNRDIRLKLKEKYLNDFIIDHNVDNFKSKTLSKFKEMGSSAEYLKHLEDDINDISQFILKYNLTPTLRAVYTRTAFQIPGDDRVRITIDSDVLFIREDSFDKDRPIRNPNVWHREDIDSNPENPYKFLRKNEYTKFPHSAMEIKIKNNSGHKGSELNGISIPFSRKHGKWIEELTTSHLVKEVPNFSKFIQGIASLFLEDDRLDILPFWLPELEDDIRQNPEDALDEAKLKELKKQDIKSRIERNFENSTKKNKPSNDSQTVQTNNGIDLQSSDDEHHHSQQQRRQRQTRFLPRTRDEIIPFLTGGSKLANVDSEDEELELPIGVKKPTSLLKQARPVKIEAKVWLANERTFNRWLTVTSMFTVMTFSLQASVKKSGNEKLADVLAYGYFALTLFCGIWGYFVYNRRLSLIRLRDGKHLDAPLGPLIVALGVLVAIITNFVVGFRHIGHQHAQQFGINAINDQVHPLVNWVNTKMFKLVGAEGW